MKSNIRIFITVSILMGLMLGITIWRGSFTEGAEAIKLISMIYPEPNETIKRVMGATYSQKDAEELAYVKDLDALWIADDDNPSIYSIDKKTGKLLDQMSAKSFILILPEINDCKNDAVGNYKCSYIDEFETVAYDEKNKVMYVFNSISNQFASPPVDKPAAYKLVLDTDKKKFQLKSWRKLEERISPDSACVIDNEIYIGTGNKLFRYNYEKNKIGIKGKSGERGIVVLKDVKSDISGLAFDGEFLWVVADDNAVYKYYWKTKKLIMRLSLTPFGLKAVKGIEVIADSIYILEGEPPNPIYIFKEIDKH